MNAERRKKRQIRNLICIQYCAMELLLVLMAFEILGIGLKYCNKRQIQNETMVVHQESDNLQEEPEDGQLVVCIDAGHGGKDNGSDYRKRMEKDDNLKLAKAVASYLEQKDVHVVMTREEDEFLSLEKRCRIANEAEANYFLSLHRNDGDGYGVETWVYSGADVKTMKLAETIMQKLDEVGIQRNRGVRQGTQKSGEKDYYVNTHSDMPSCIVEMGFINSDYDNSLFDEKLEDYAVASGEAILAVSNEIE